jgi:hypothetical protein
MVAVCQHPSHEWLGYFQRISPITYEAGAGEKTSELSSRKSLMHCPCRENEGRIKD